MYKVNDLVRIITNNGGHRFPIGEIVRIIKIEQKYEYRAEYLDGHDHWWIGDDEIELVGRRD